MPTAASHPESVRGQLADDTTLHDSIVGTTKPQPGLSQSSRKALIGNCRLKALIVNCRQLGLLDGTTEPSGACWETISPRGFIISSKQASSDQRIADGTAAQPHSRCRTGPAQVLPGQSSDWVMLMHPPHGQRKWAGDCCHRHGRSVNDPRRLPLVLVRLVGSTPPAVD